MANLKRSPVSYQPFKGRAILADGLLAVARPGGEAERALAGALFGAADIFRERAERTAAAKGKAAGLAAALDASPDVTVAGGDRQPAADDSIETTDLMPRKPGTAGIAAQGGPVKEIIKRAAARYGLPPGMMIGIAQIESRLNPKAKNPTSSAGGLFQQIDENAAQYGVRNRFDAAQSADGAARFARDNMAYLRKKLGRAPTWGEMYLAHQQGPGGAAKLLANPNELAVNVVGRRRVLLNGGNANMTAAQFARLWTQKLDGDAPRMADAGVGEMPAIDLTADEYSFTEGPRDPLQIAASGQAPRLTGRDTIFGRAYDEVATETYAARLQDAMLSGIDEISATYADDPAGMREAFEMLKDEQLDGDVPDAIRLEYETAFNRVTRRQLRGAQETHEKKLRAADQDAWSGASSGLEEGVSRAMVALENGDEDGMTQLAIQASRMKRHWRDGVAKGYITPRQAQEAAARLDSDVASQWFISQGRGKSGDDIDALREQLQQDYAAGKLEGVDARGWSRIEGGLKRMAQDERATVAEKDTKLVKLADDMLGRAALGYSIPAAEIEALRGAAAGVPDGDDVVSGTLLILDMAEELKNEPVGAAEAGLQRLKDLFGKTPNTRQTVLIGKAGDMLATARKALAEDPLGYAERAGVIESAGSLADVKTPEDMALLVEGRLAAATQVATHFGIGESFFRPGEVKAIEAMVTADPDQGAAMAASIVKASGERANLVLRAFGEAAPVLAGAGAIIAGGGDAVAARDAIAGSGKDENGKAYESKGWQARKDAGLRVTGLGLIFNQKDEKRVLDTAERIARKRISDAGVAADSDEALAIMERATQEAAGAVFDGDAQWGGFAGYDPGLFQSEQRVLVPNAIRADRVQDVIMAVRDDDLAQKPQGGVARLQELWPVLTPDGYVFVDFDADGGPVPLAGEDGKVFRLDLVKLAPVLGKRVPGAIRGY